MLEILDAEVFAIITLTLRMTLLSTAISSVIGIPLGLWLDSVSFAGKNLVVIINRTLMASPPVVVGLVVFLLFTRHGPFGFLGLMFTFEAMVIAQVILISLIICGIVYTASRRSSGRIRVFALTMGATKRQTQTLLIKELSNEIFFASAYRCWRISCEKGSGEPMKISDVTVSFERFTLHVDELALRPGEVYGIIGPNRCGKTTLMKIMAGLQKPGSGRIDHEGLTPRGILQWFSASLTFYTIRCCAILSIRL